MTRSTRLWLMLLPVIGIAAVVALSCGGSPPPGHDDPQPVCYFSSPISDAGMRPVRANEWANLVVRGYHDGSTSSQDCVGNNIEWHPTDRQCEVHEPDDERPPTAQPVTEESVVIGRSDSPMVKPVWVITHRFENGDGFGPVVITQRRDLGVAVRAIGTLRLPSDRARLRLRETGGQQLLIADGERCPEQEEEGEGDDDDAPPANAPTKAPPAAAPAAGGGGDEEEEEEPTCLRATRIMVVVGDEIMNPEVRDADGNHCIGPALVYNEREEVVGLENGWERVFTLAASMEYDGAAIIIHEQVIAEDRDPRDPGRPPNLFRTTDHDRYIFVNRGQMRSRGVPLFERAIRAAGSVQLPIARSGGNGEQSGSGQGQGAQN